MRTTTITAQMLLTQRIIKAAMYRLPSRQPVEDLIEATLIRESGQILVALEPQPDAEVIAQGMISLRYGLVYLGRSYHCIMPELVALDTGGGFAGDEAWDFLINKSNLFPRADVIGFREDGIDDMVTVKSLDLMHPVRVFAFAPHTAPVNTGQVAAIVAASVTDLPARLLEALPVFATLAHWREQQP